MTDDTLTGFLDTWDGSSDPPWAGMRAVRDDALGTLHESSTALRVVLTGGAGQLAGPVDLCGRRGLPLGALDTTVRDLDDPAGAVRRVVTAAADLPEDVLLHVRVGGSPDAGWLRALDVLAETEAVVALPLASVEVEPWVDAALDRELRTSLVGGTAEQAVDALRTTARLWGDPDDLRAARRWLRCWLTDDAPGATSEAVAHLAAR